MGGGRFRRARDADVAVYFSTGEILQRGVSWTQLKDYFNEEIIMLSTLQIILSIVKYILFHRNNYLYFSLYMICERPALIVHTYYVYSLGVDKL